MEPTKVKRKRSKKKWFIWIGSILGALIILAGVGGYFAVNYAADKVLDSMMDEALAPATNASSSPASDTTDSVGSNVDGASASDEPASSPSQSDSSSDKPTDKPTDKPKSDSSPSPSASPTYQADITVDKAEKVKEDISFAEKTKVLTVMLKRLSADDIKTLQKLSSGGLTGEKKKEAKAIILQKLTEDEYNELIAVAKKYGLSQGKSYAESQKEDLSQ